MIISTRKLLHIALILPGRQCQRNNAADVHVRAVDVHIELELFSNGLDIPETFLIVGTCATNPDLDLVLDQCRGEFS